LDLLVSRGITEVLLQPSVPVAEQCTQSRCDDRCGGTQRCAEL